MKDKLSEIFIVLLLMFWCIFVFIYIPHRIFSNSPPVQIVKADMEDVRLSLLSKIINAEADPKDSIDGYLVGSTILNRAELSHFPSTTDSVILQENQYHGVEAENFVRTPYSDTIASNLLRGVNHNCNVLYFYSQKANKKFKNKFNNQCTFITKSVSHKFFGTCK